MVIILTACQKETVLEKTTSTFPYPQSNFSKTQVIQNEEDKEDELVNQKLFSLSEYLAEEVITQPIAETITNLAKENDGEVSFKQLFQYHPELEELLKKREDFAHRNNPMIYQNVSYLNMLTVPNWKLVKNLSQFVVAPGIDVEDDVENDNHDILHAWAISKNTVIGNVKVGEKDAMNSNIAVIVLTQDTEEDKDNTPLQENIIPASTTRDQMKTSSTNYDVESLKIEHRYDSSKYSEVYFTGYRFEPWPNVNFVLTSLLNGEIQDEERWKLDKIHKNDIGETQSINADFINSAPYGDFRVIFNTYERDWYT